MTGSAWMAIWKHRREKGPQTCELRPERIMRGRGAKSEIVGAPWARKPRNRRAESTAATAPRSPDGCLGNAPHRDIYLIQRERSAHQPRCVAQNATVIATAPASVAITTILTGGPFSNSLLRVGTHQCWLGVTSPSSAPILPVRTGASRISGMVMGLVAIEVFAIMALM